MRKYVKFTLCALAVLMLVAGCSKKEKTGDTATASNGQTATASNAKQEKAIDPGKVKKLGEYKGVEVTRMSTEVTDEELEAQIKSIVDANPERIEITDRAAKDGDNVNIDFVGMKDGEAFDGGTGEGYDLVLGSGAFIPGFEEGLIGAKTGDELSLDLTFPEDYGNTDLAGQAVVFDVTVNKIEEVKEAVLDDSFVQRISDFATVDEFRADTLASMKKAKEQQAEQQFESDVFLAAMNNTTFDVNPAAVDQQYNNQMSSYENMVQMYGMTIKDYASMYGMTEEEFKTQLRSSAELAVKQQILIKAIAKKEKLKVEDADREIVAEQMGTDLKTLQDTYTSEKVDEAALMYKVVTLIKENAVVK